METSGQDQHRASAQIPLLPRIPDSERFPPHLATVDFRVHIGVVEGLMPREENHLIWPDSARLRGIRLILVHTVGDRDNGTISKFGKRRDVLEITCTMNSKTCTLDGRSKRDLHSTVSPCSYNDKTLFIASHSPHVISAFSPFRLWSSMSEAQSAISHAD
ncbi:hypothetical protein VTN00DRAFT_1484 [Thermoascus crustaceus]|uniref:uncharacterized protein n=1 Tax=Thermoascus crustaceus TaxID=5088 RepID=UPI0037425438